MAGIASTSCMLPLRTAGGGVNVTPEAGNDGFGAVVVGQREVAAGDTLTKADAPWIVGVAETNIDEALIECFSAPDE